MYSWTHGDRCKTVTKKIIRYGTIVQRGDGKLTVIWDDEISADNYIDQSGMTYGQGFGFVAPRRTLNNAYNFGYTPTLENIGIELRNIYRYLCKFIKAII